jgi:murein DD-endopeptidase MepM/ murein hydrolase activator NlpD
MRVRSTDLPAALAVCALGAAGLIVASCGLLTQKESDTDSPQSPQAQRLEACGAGQAICDIDEYGLGDEADPAADGSSPPSSSGRYGNPSSGLEFVDEPAPWDYANEVFTEFQDEHDHGASRPTTFRTVSIIPGGPVEQALERLERQGEQARARGYSPVSPPPDEGEPGASDWEPWTPAPDEPDSNAATTDQKLMLPIAANKISRISPFGMRMKSTGRRKMHHGVDLYAPPGTPITAVAKGIVVAVLEDNPARPETETTKYGKVLMVAHPQFSPMIASFNAHNSQNIARLGQEVNAGEMIARVGRTDIRSKSIKDHNHFEIRECTGTREQCLDFSRGTDAVYRDIFNGSGRWKVRNPEDPDLFGCLPYPRNGDHGICRK